MKEKNVRSERNEVFERGIDKFEVGQLVVISFPSYMDENIVNRKRYKSKETRKQIIKREIQSGPKLPAIILDKRLDSELDWPLYRVGFTSRTNSGEVSGIIELVDFCVWRYLAPDDKSDEGTPPDWMLDSVKETEIEWCGVDVRNIFYTEGDKKIYIKDK